MSDCLQADSIQPLIAAARAGSSSALLNLLGVVSPHVYAAIRRHLPRDCRRRFDSDDIAQAVWGSFFAESANLRRFQQVEDLIAFLSQMARNKLADNAKRETRLRRDQRRTIPLDSELRDTLPAKQARPSQAVVKRELVERAMETRSQRDRAILELRSSGYSHQEIAAELAIHPGSVRRIIARCISEMQAGSVE